MTFVLSVYRQLPTSPLPTTMTSTPDMTSELTTVVMTTVASSKDNLAILIVEIVVPCVVVVAVVIIIVVIILRKRRKKVAETMYNIKDTERSGTNKYADESRISTLSSTPINPYELMSVYANMPFTTDNAKSEATVTYSGTSADDVTKTADVSVTSEAASVDKSVDEYESVDSAQHLSADSAFGNDSLYAVVDKRRNRKRVVAGQEMNDSFDNENEALEPEAQDIADETEAVSFGYLTGTGNVKMEDVALY